MAKRALIGYKQDNAYTFSVIRGDVDPYPKKSDKISDAKKLNDNYKSFSEVTDLVDGGEIEELGNTISTTKYADGETFAFFDWKEVVRFAKNKNASFIFLFDKIWYFADYSEKMTLKDLKTLEIATDSVVTEKFKSFRSYLEEINIELG